MAIENVNDAIPVPIASAAGDLVAVKDSAEPGKKDFVRIPISELQVVAQKAASAVQPADIGSAAALDVEDVGTMIDARLGDIEAALAAILGPQ